MHFDTWFDYPQQFSGQFSEATQQLLLLLFKQYKESLEKDLGLLYICMCVYFGCPGSSLLRTGFFSGCGQWGFLIVVRGLLIAVVSLVEEHRLQVYRLSSCYLWLLGFKVWAQQLWCLRMWNCPGPVIQPVSPTLAGGWILNHCTTREVLVYIHTHTHTHTHTLCVYICIYTHKYVCVCFCL